MAPFPSTFSFVAVRNAVHPDWPGLSGGSITEEALDRERQRRERFVSTLAHELRQPLSVLRSSVDALGLEAAPVAPLRRVMVRQLELMTRLVEDLTDASRWAHGRLSLHRRQVDIRELLDVAVRDIAAVLDERGHRLIVDFPGTDPVWAEADPQRLGQVLGNLLRNAAAATDPGGLIALVAERGGDSLTLRVRDSGRGMTPDTLSRIFDWFSQVPPAGTPGLGIGLSIAREIVELHGGRIIAASGGPGAGSEFTVTLPLTASASPVVERAGYRRVDRPHRDANASRPAGLRVG